MEKIRESFRKTALITVFFTILIILPACAPDGAMKTLPVDSTRPSPVQADQFNTIVKGGVEIACPKDWSTYSTDPCLFYGVCRLNTIRIVTAILPALSQSYYDGLVAQGTVNLITTGAYPAYRNDYTYNLNGLPVTSICVTAISGGEACHFMFLCDTAALADYQPVFDYVLGSLKFL